MELKIGGKITLSENEVYYILEIVNYEGKKYLFCYPKSITCTSPVNANETSKICTIRKKIQARNKKRERTNSTFDNLLFLLYS